LAGCGGVVYYDPAGVTSAARELINAPGEAWVDTYPAGERDGYIFREDGTAARISDLSGNWELVAEGTWFASGEIIYITHSDWPDGAPYSVSGDTLTINISYKLVKTGGMEFAAAPKYLSLLK